MRNAFPPERHSFVCQCCGRTIVTAIDGLFANPAVGSPRRFCSPACRQAAWRRRRQGVEENTPPQRQGGRARRLRPDPQAIPALPSDKEVNTTTDTEPHHH
jgi:hypothetical protein